MSDRFRVGEWLVERQLNSLSAGEGTIQVEPKVMEVLVYLADNAARVLSRQEIMSAVWPDTHVTPDVLTYSISELRKALGDDARQPRFIQTVPRRGYRLIAPVAKELSPAVPAAASEGPALETAVPAGRGRARRLVVSTAAAALILTLFLLSRRSSAPLSEADLVLLTDFVNTTGDPVFDGTLKHALAVHLEQTPFLSVFSEERARETLVYMGRSPNEPVTRELGREICFRRGVKAMLSGSISRLGREYVISLEALNAQSGDVIAREQFEAVSKEEVLRSLGKVATRMRKRLGESLGSIERFDVPLEQATTASLEAFKAYSLGRKHLVSGRISEALPYYQRALEFDPNFASAYDDIAWCYDYFGQRERAAEAAERAYALKDRVSEYERLSIEAIYHTFASGDVNRAIEVLELMRGIYPHNAPVHNTLGGRYASAGRLDKAVECFTEAIRISRHPNAYPQLAGVYLRLNRLAEAKDIIRQAREQGLDSREIRALSYTIAFLQGDRPQMDFEAAKSSGHPDEYAMISLQAAATASRGHLAEARRLQQRAIEVAREHNLPEIATGLTAEAARREAVFGNCREALRYTEALGDSEDWGVLVRNAHALALCGDPDRAGAIADRLEDEHPDHTLIRGLYLPVIRATIEVRNGRPAKAIETLKGIGSDTPASLWPSYVAGEAYLAQRAAKDAEAEFRRILDNGAGPDPFSPVYVLARLGLAKAERLSGELSRSRSSYQQFLSFWSAADPDLPILRQARSELETLIAPAPASGN